VIPFPFDMSGKTVVVTGSTRGIGLALAKGFHACGARTIISSNMQDDVGAAPASLRRDGAELEGIVCDLWNPESVRTVAARVAIDRPALRRIELESSPNRRRVCPAILIAAGGLDRGQNQTFPMVTRKNVGRQLCAAGS
jgi:NAD(P)-dependent dehydrogenase (short-subunit alcohol dehydrogenase family)